MQSRSLRGILGKLTMLRSMIDGCVYDDGRDKKFLDGTIADLEPLAGGGAS